MALPAVGESTYPTPDEVLAVLLASIKLGAQSRGLSVNVTPLSDHYIRTKAFASRVAIAIANGQIARDDFNPLTATGDNLTALAGMHGLSLRPASRAAGYVTCTVSTGSAPIPAGFQATAPSGEKYRATTAATVSNGGKVQLQAVEGGEATNLPAGTKLTWDSASIGNLARICIVDINAIDGGADGDDEEDLRRRLIDKLASPGIGGNAAQVKEWAEESSASVERAYVYAAVRGPGSYDIAITAEGGDRELSSVIVGSVATYVASQHPGHVDLNVTSVSGQEVDVLLAANLALPTNAGGAGGGWIDAVPWPNSTSGDVQVTAYASLVVTTDATALDGLVNGATIGLWDTSPDEPVMRTYKVYDVALSGGFCTFKTTPEFSATMDYVDTYVSAGAVNLASYAATALAKIEALGPGEKTDNADILPRGKRTPTVSDGAESDLNSRLLTQIQSAHPEIRSLEYSARYDAGTTTPRTAPSVPSTTANAPRILVLNNLAIRRG